MVARMFPELLSVYPTAPASLPEVTMKDNSALTGDCPDW